MEQTFQTDDKSSIRYKEIPLDFPKSLDEIDVSVSTASKYKAQLAEAAREKRKKGTTYSPFFSSPPVDLGYTDASMLDKIIAG